MFVVVVQVDWIHYFVHLIVISVQRSARWWDRTLIRVIVLPVTFIWISLGLQLVEAAQEFVAQSIKLEFKCLSDRFNAGLNIPVLLFLVGWFSVQPEFWWVFIQLRLALWDCIERILSSIDRIELPYTLLIFLLELLFLRIFEQNLLRLKQVIPFLKRHVLALLSCVQFLHVLVLVIFKGLVDVKLLVLIIKVLQRQKW